MNASRTFVCMAAMYVEIASLRCLNNAGFFKEKKAYVAVKPRIKNNFFEYALKFEIKKGSLLRFFLIANGAYPCVYVYVQCTRIKTVYIYRVRHNW